jgi:pimeloyl-ACP methyl ester carboxylesterase
MAFFQFQDQKVSYELFAEAVPEDTLLLHDGHTAWHGVSEQLKMNYSDQSVSGRLATALWGDSTAFKDLAALIRGLGMSEVHLLATPQAALVALLAAVATPDLIAKVLLVNSSGANELQKLAHVELRTHFAQLHQPVLLLQGTSQSPLLIQDVKNLQSYLPSSKFMELHEDLQALMTSNPAIFCQTLTGFFYTL